MNALSAPRFYLIGEAAQAFLSNMAWIIFPVYCVLAAHMNPLQLVLLGTTFELTIFLFEVPTGLLADTYSRRLSVIAGWSLLGAALVLEGFVPLFGVILLAQIVDGLGTTFVSGAWNAWLADEVGEERFGPLLARGSQARQIGAFAGTVAGALLAAIHLQLPIVLAGALCGVLALVGGLAMPEHSFHRPHHREQLPWQVMAATLHRSVDIVRAQAMVLVIFAIAAIFGAFSEGIDWLGEPHFLTDVGLPPVAGLQSVVWFGLIGGVGLLLSAGAMELPRRRVRMQSHRSVTRALLLVNAGIVLSALTFALVPNFVLALAAYWGWVVLRAMVDLLSTVWLNQNIPNPEVRATVLSMSSQANALGEWAGGPGIGLIGTIFSIRAALAAGALLLSPALGLYSWALRRGGGEPLVTGASVSHASEAGEGT